MIDETHSLVEYETKGRDGGTEVMEKKGDDDILGTRRKAGATLI